MIQAPIKVFLTGAAGQIGHDLAALLRARFDLIAPARGALDLADPRRVRAAVRAARPALIVNAAAYTRVDDAEREPEAAHALNAGAPLALAEAARECGAGLIHYSTDYVFDGARDRPYREDDEPRPLGVYGASKLAGERAVLDALEPALVLRTSWVYGARRVNFMLKMLELFRTREEVRVVDDQTGTPNWCRSLAEATVHILDRALRHPGGPSDFLTAQRGLYHLSLAGSTSWFGFARAIHELAPPELAAAFKQQGSNLIPARRADFPAPAARPAHSVLDSGKMRNTFGLDLPPWELELGKCLRAMAAVADGPRLG